MNTRRLLVAVVVLQALILLTLWSGGRGAAAPAEAQIPDAGAQRVEMIHELRAINQRVDGINRLLEGGNLQVRSVSPDEDR